MKSSVSVDSWNCCLCMTSSSLRVSSVAFNACILAFVVLVVASSAHSIARKYMLNFDLFGYVQLNL